MLIIVHVCFKNNILAKTISDKKQIMSLTYSYKKTRNKEKHTW